MEATYGSTSDISIFCFPWFSPVWYYNPTTDFPEDKMSPGFFLDIAENTGDTFSYVILPGQNFDNIPTKGRIYPIVWNIVRKQKIDETDALIIRRSTDALSFYNNQGKELVGADALNIANDFDYHHHDDIDDSQRDMDSLTSEFNADDTLNIRYRDPPSFSDSLLSPIPEDEVSEEQSEQLEEPHPLEDAPLVTEEPLPKQQQTLFPQSKPDVPMVSQNDSADSDKEMDSPPLPQNQFNDTLAHLNVIFDQDDAENTCDLKSILDHRYISSVLELCCKYSIGNTIHDEEWHPLSLVQDEDPYTVSQYVLATDFGTIQNGKLCCWAQAFLCSLKKTLRKLKQVDWNGFCASTFFPTPCHPQFCSRQSRQSLLKCRDAHQAEKVENKRPSKKKAEFKYFIEISKNWAVFFVSTKQPVIQNGKMPSRKKFLL